MRGITIVETLLSLTILSIALVPAYQLSSSALSLARSIQNNVTAANLAQEGVEVIRALRDTNWFNTQPFDTGLTTCGSGCRVQWKSTALLGLNSNPILTIHPTSGVYYYKDIEGNLGGVDTIFSRKITITNVSSDQLKVQSEVSWTERDRAKSIVLESHLFNWK